MGILLSLILLALRFNILSFFHRRTQTLNVLKQCIEIKDKHGRQQAPKKRLYLTDNDTLPVTELRFRDAD